MFSTGPRAAVEYRPTRSFAQHRRHSAVVALSLLVPAPTIGVIMAMMLPATQGTAFGKAVYAVSKVWIVLLPLIWTLWVDRSRLHVTKPWASRGLGVGALLGVAIAAAIVGTYALLGNHLINVDQMRVAAMKNGIGTPANYLALVVGLALVNSLVEEYVWRWFVFGQCERLTNGFVAVLISAAFFTLHHFFALIAQAPLGVTLLACLGVFIGGCAWSWCYLKFRSIWPGWVSHILVDLAVFGVGYMVLFGSTAAN